MKTSKAQRTEEYLRLKMLSINGRLVIRQEIKRWRQLRAEFDSALKIDLKDANLGKRLDNQ